MKPDPAVRIREIFIERFRESMPSVADMTLETPLIGSGLALDSLDALSLITDIEAEFGIMFDDDDLTPELFENVAALARVVARKIPPAPEEG